MLKYKYLENSEKDIIKGEFNNDLSITSFYHQHKQKQKQFIFSKI